MGNPPAERLTGATPRVERSSPQVVERDASHGARAMFPTLPRGVARTVSVAGNVTSTPSHRNPAALIVLDKSRRSVAAIPDRAQLSRLNLKLLIVAALALPAPLAAQSTDDRARAAATAARAKSSDSDRLLRNYVTPGLAGQPVSTVDSSRTFTPSLACQKTATLLELLVQPAASGDLTMVRISRDTNLDGNFDATATLPVPVSGISDTMPLVGHLLKKAAITVMRDDQAHRQVRINRTELQQVLVNLMVNAIDAMPGGGTLTLRSYDAEGASGEPGAAIEVQDSGTGMSRDVLARIFDAFFTTKQREGNGLGLAICQMLVSRAGGTLTASSAPGTGSNFVLWLPEAADAAPVRQGHSV